MSDVRRCDVCGWPLAQSPDDGCVADNCSMRPRPSPTYREKLQAASHPNVGKVNVDTVSFGAGPSMAPGTLRVERWDEAGGVYRLAYKPDGWA